MSSRWPDLARLLLAALLEALWFGAAAALLVAAAPAATVPLCWAIVAGGALLAAAASSAPPAQLRYRLALLVFGLAITAALVAGTASHGVGQTIAVVVRSAVFVGVSLELGLLAGRAEIDSERALSRAVRAFALVFSVVLLSFATGEPLAGSGVLVVFVVLAGLASVAVARVLATLQAIEGRRSVWRWTTGVVLAGLLALALAALIAAVPGGGALASLGGVVLIALDGVLDAVGYGLAAGGYLVMRALTAIFGLFHVHLHRIELRPSSTTVFGELQQRQVHPRSALPQIVALVALVALGLAAAALLLRSFRVERGSAGEAAVEERERLASPAAEARAAGGRLVRRLARLIGGRPRMPAEALRAEYRRLERSLGRSGIPRELSSTVRRYLGSLPGDPATTARLATLYERARYADPASGVGWPDVDEFRRARKVLLLNRGERLDFDDH
jgi:hypothetical protein